MLEVVYFSLYISVHKHIVVKKKNKTKVILNREFRFKRKFSGETEIYELESILGSSITSIAKKYGFDESTLGFRLKRRDANLVLKKPHRK